MNERLEASDLNREEARSLLAWWIEAGVHTAIQEEPRTWRAAPSPRAAPPPAVAAPPSDPVAPQAPSAPASRPATLDAFHAWLAESADLPLFRAGAARALPHGPAQAELMLVAPIPSSEDSAEGRPLGGAAWTLTTRMLRAVGLDQDTVYVASLTCFSGAGTRFSSAETDHCRETLLAQIALAAPKRLLLLGDQPAKLLLGQPLATARGRLQRIAGIPAVVTFPPRHLLANNGHKAMAWADLLMIMGAIS